MEIVNRPQIILDDRDRDTLARFKQIVDEYYDNPFRNSFEEYLEQNYCMDSADFRLFIALFHSF